MKKRIVSILLALCMVICLLPIETFAYTAGKAAATNSEVVVTVTSAAEFIKAIEDSNTRTDETTVIRIGKRFTVSLSECEGYFLIKTKVIIDLNYHGFSIKQDIDSDKAFYLTDGAELTIRDSVRGQYGVMKIIGNGKKAISAVRFSGKSNATLRMESGVVEGENLEYNRKMVDGRVYGTPGGFVRLDEKNSTFIMTGGTIKNFYGVYGGAVSVEYGKFVMEGGTIQNCYARNGGAISVDYGKNAVLTIGGGSGTPVIKNNSAIGPGGGLAVSDASSKVEIKGGLFEDNYSTGSDDAPVNLKNGAELYVGYGCEVKMSGGTIKNSGTGQYAISSEGKLTVTGDAVIDVGAEHCTLSCAGGNNYFFDFDNGYAIIKGKYAAGDAFPISETNGLRFGADENSLGEIKQGFRNEDISNAQYIKIAKKRTVTFKLAENEPTTLSSQTVLQGEKIKKPDDPPARDGYVFNDVWAIPSGGGYIHWNFDDDVLTEDTTLYGRWSGYRVKVTFNANGYSMSGPSEIYGEYGQKLKDLRDVPTINPASFMKFIGWYTHSSGGTKVDENTVLTANMTLYAKCAPQYTVFICFLYENDEEQKVTLQTMNHLDENGRVPKPSVQPVHKTGYVFDDWYVGEVSYGSLTDNYTNLKTVADLFREYGTMVGAQGRIDLVARYVERNDYSAIFKSEDSVIDTKSNLKWTDKVLDGVSVPTRDGYDFVGWTYNDITVTADTLYSDLAADDSMTEITLAAQWREKDSFTVRFDTSGGSEIADKRNVKWNDIVFEGVANPTKNGYDFVGWTYNDMIYTADTYYSDLAADDSVESITLTAQWREKNGFTVRFDTAGGTNIADKTNVKWTDKVLEGVESPVRSTYEFIGWTYNDKPFTADASYADLAVDDSVKSITLTAKWRDIENPTGEIVIGTNRWNQLLYNITFGLFFKETQIVTINAADNSGEKVRVEYLLSGREMTILELADAIFTEYKGPFSINPDHEYIIYVSLVDTAGNGRYICSEGMVLDGTSPEIKGIENGKIYCEAQTVTIDEDYIDTVTVNGTEVTLDENNSFVLSPTDGEQNIVVTDKAGNTSEMTVTVNNGHTFGEWKSNGDGTHTRKCTVDKCSGTETDNCADGDKNHKCDVCNTPLSEHTDADKNHICDYCGEIITNHSGGKATCAEKAVCEICDKAYGEFDGANHSDLRHIDAKAATEIADGNIEYWYCDGCGKYYSDASATKEIAKADTVTAKLTKEPNTGDSSLSMWILLLFVSGGAVGITVIGKKKKRSAK